MKDNGAQEKISEAAGAVVVGVDGSASSLRALEWAINQARLTGQRLVAITTWEWPPNYGESIAWPEDLDFEKDAKKVLLDSVTKILGDDSALRVTQLVVHGHPAPVLVAASREAALLVVGNRGHGEFAGMLLGSVGEFLATHAQCPVVIVRS
jgi:nucleotide-binding universal stress UspA family protein